MKLYNTLTREKDEFVTNEPGVVRMYTCGPTVYHFAHIGNLRTYIMEDVLEKYLGYSGYDVKRVMNITDVGHLTSDADTGEDKMLAGARREKKTVMDIARFYTDAFFADCEKLNIRKPATVVPATTEIAEFIKVVEALIENGHAYVSDGNVYFDTSKLDEYYVFNRHDADDLEEGVREGVGVDAAKKNKTDFVLWFTKSKFEDQELKWESPWGLGYPGWHIECSAISMKYLGERLDLHCGGIDNAFPHHTNEIAQSEAYLGHKWCNFWFHVHHLNTNHGKMSKSSGEFLTVSLLEEKGYDPLAYRLFCLGSHYRKNLTFSWEGLDGAASSYAGLVKKVAALKGPAKIAPGDEDEAKKLDASFREALDSDLNTSMAVTVLYDVFKAKIAGGTKLALIGQFDEVLSLGLLAAAEKAKESEEKADGNDGIDEELRAKIEDMIRQRADAKAAKNYAEADRIRDELTAMGVTLADSKEGTTYKIG